MSKQNTFLNLYRFSLNFEVCSLEYIYTGLRNNCLYGAQIGPTKYLATLPDCNYSSFTLLFAW